MARDKAKKAASDKAYYELHKDEIKEYQAAYRERHRAKTKEYNARYVAANKAALAEQQKWYVVKSKYGITKEDFQRMWDEQSGVCAICGDGLATPHIDHDHVTGRVRGILCPSCNIGLGRFKDDVSRLKSGIAYLERFA